MTEQVIVIFSNVDSVLAAPVPQLREAGRILGRLESDSRLVLCSGRTRAELEYVSQELGIRQPFVCEHGSAAFVPNKYFDEAVAQARDVFGNAVVEFGRRCPAVVQTLNRTASRLRIAIRGFNDMSVDEVARDCGMTPLQARLAKLRDYGEMFRVLNRDESARLRLLRALESAYLKCVRGVDYDYVGGTVDYSPAINLLSTMYRRSHAPIVTVGCVATECDGHVREVVDFPVQVFGSHASAGSCQRGATAAVAVDVCAWAEMLVGIVDGIREGNVLTHARAH